MKSIVNDFKGYEILNSLFPNIYTTAGIKDIINVLDDNIVWDNTNQVDIVNGKSMVESMLLKRGSKIPLNTKLKIDKITDGSYTVGFTWYLSSENMKNGKGLRGTTFVEFNPDNKKIKYVREICEPLYKPGSVVANLLKSVAEAEVKKDPSLAIRPQPPIPRIPKNNANDIVSYLWKEINGSDMNLVLEVFDENIIYEDFNYPIPFMGKEQVTKFLKEFDVPGIQFIPEKISEGTKSCCFTWSVRIGNLEKATKGISFYECNDENNKIIYIRDIAEPLIKPAPLQELAAIINPDLRRFQPILT